MTPDLRPPKPVYFWPLVTLFWGSFVLLGAFAILGADEAAKLREFHRLTALVEAGVGQAPDCPPGPAARNEARPGDAGSKPAPQAQRPAAAPEATAQASGGRRVALGSTELLARVERATVIIISDGGSGTGFFINPRQIVTNRHVVEEARDGQVFVTSANLGLVRPGRVRKVTQGSEFGSPDFALVEVDGPTKAEALPLTHSVAKLLRVVAAGYPGLTLGSDPAFKRLLEGDPAAAPDLNFTDGTVSTIQDTQYGLKQIAHSASILRGNSGGPLVDLCGRVVGVNTFFTVDQEQSGRLNYALSAGDLGTFLAGAQAGAEVDDAICE